MNAYLSIMERISIRLIHSQPFFAALLAQMRKIPCETEQLKKQIPTEAVAIENGRINFYYNPDFLETLTVDEAVAVLTHELHHVILGHLTRMRDEYRENPTLANISQDMNCNRNIKNLPKDCCTVETITKQFAKQGIKVDLKEDDTSENYYAELNKHSNKYSVETDANGNMELVIKDPNGKEIGRMKITMCSNKDKQSDGKSNGDIPELAKEVIRQAIKEAYDQTIRQRGDIPSGLEKAIQEWLAPPVVSWRTLLKQFVAASIKSGHKMSWKRPNRRFGAEQKGTMSDRNIQINVAIDTSGSISTEDYKAFIAELHEIQACYKGSITILECDAEIQNEYKLTKYSKMNLKFKGGGGTSFKPIFEHIADKKIKTDCLVFFTDGYGDQESCKKPNYPVLWVLSTSKQQIKFPFGHTISLVDNADKKKK